MRGIPKYCWHHCQVSLLQSAYKVFRASKGHYALMGLKQYCQQQFISFSSLHLSCLQDTSRCSCCSMVMAIGDGFLCSCCCCDFGLAECPNKIGNQKQALEHCSKKTEGTTHRQICSLSLGKTASAMKYALYIKESYWCCYSSFHDWPCHGCSLINTRTSLCQYTADRLNLA